MTWSGPLQSLLPAFTIWLGMPWSMSASRRRDASINRSSSTPVS
jgi:hypothetical protein